MGSRLLDQVGPFKTPECQRSLLGRKGDFETDPRASDALEACSGAVGMVSPTIAGKVCSGGKGEQDADQQYGGDHQGAPLTRQQVVTDAAPNAAVCAYAASDVAMMTVPAIKYLS